MKGCCKCLFCQVRKSEERRNGLHKHSTDERYSSVMPKKNEDHLKGHDDTAT